MLLARNASDAGRTLGRLGGHVRANSAGFDYLTRQKGMFSRLPLDTAQIETLRERHGIYIVGDGRINVAGLPDDPGRLEAVADAIVTVVSAGD